MADADADALYGAYYTPYLYNSYPNWPGISGPGFQSTLYGVRGKRSADADADAGLLYGGYYGYGIRPVYGYRYGLPGVAFHGLGATSFEARSPQGLKGKRSADAEPEADADAYYRAYGYAGYPYGLGLGYGYGGYLGYRAGHLGYGYGGYLGYRAG